MNFPTARYRPSFRIALGCAHVDGVTVSRQPKPQIQSPPPRPPVQPNIRLARLSIIDRRDRVAATRSVLIHDLALRTVYHLPIYFSKSEHMGRSFRRLRRDGAILKLVELVNGAVDISASRETVHLYTYISTRGGGGVGSGRRCVLRRCPPRMTAPSPGEDTRAPGPRDWRGSAPGTAVAGIRIGPRAPAGIGRDGGRRTGPIPGTRRTQTAQTGDKVNNNKSLPTLPSLPSIRRSLRSCECGCGGSTQRRFVPGHDSKLRAWVIRVERDIVKLEDIPHDGIREAVAREMGRSAPVVLTKAQKKAARKQEQERLRQAAAEAVADETDDQEQVG